MPCAPFPDAATAVISVPTVYLLRRSIANGLPLDAVAVRPQDSICTCMTRVVYFYTGLLAPFSSDWESCKSTRVRACTLAPAAWWLMSYARIDVKVCRENQRCLQYIGVELIQNLASNFPQYDSPPCKAFLIHLRRKCYSLSRLRRTFSLYRQYWWVGIYLYLWRSSTNVTLTQTRKWKPPPARHVFKAGCVSLDIWTTECQASASRCGHVT